MKYFWKDGFYVEGDSPAIPEDAKEITRETYESLLEGQSTGKVVSTNPATGMPELLPVPTPQATAADYDNAMEAHLKAERIARGYTTREPSDYAGSSVPRWSQDAADWIAHRDAVMLYGLQVQTSFAAGGTAPTLEEFSAALPIITWPWTGE